MSELVAEFAKDVVELAEAKKRVENYSPLRTAYGVLGMLDTPTWGRIVELGGVKLPTVGKVFTDSRNTGLRVGVEKTMIMPTVSSTGIMKAAMDHAEEHLGLRSGVVKATFDGLSRVLRVEFLRRTISAPHEAWKHKMKNEGRPGIAGPLGVHKQRALVEPISLVGESGGGYGEQARHVENEMDEKITEVVKTVAREFVANQERWAKGDPYLERLKAILGIEGNQPPLLSESLHKHDWGLFIGNQDDERRRVGEPMVRVISKLDGKCLDLPLVAMVSRTGGGRPFLVGGEDLVFGGAEYKWRPLDSLGIDDTNPPLVAVSVGTDLETAVSDLSLSKRDKFFNQRALGGRGLQVDVVTEGRKIKAIDVSAGHYSYDGIQVSGILDLLLTKVFDNPVLKTPEYQMVNLGIQCEQEVLPPLPVELDKSHGENDWQRVLGFGEVVTRVMFPEQLQQEVLTATKSIGKDVARVSVEVEDRVIEIILENLSARAMAPEHKVMVAMIRADLAEPDERKRKLIPVLRTLLFPKPSVVFWQQAALQIVGRDETSVGICVATGSREDRLNIGIGTKLGENLTAFGIRMTESVSAALANGGKEGLADVVNNVVVTEMPNVAAAERGELIGAFRKNWKEMRMAEAMANVFAVMVSLSGDNSMRSILESTGAILANDFAKFFVGMKSQVSSLMGKYQFDTANSGEPGFETGFANMGRNYSARRKVTEGDIKAVLSDLMKTQEWARLGYRKERAWVRLFGTEMKADLTTLDILMKDDSPNGMIMKDRLRNNLLKKYKGEMVSTLAVMLGLVRLARGR